MAELVPVLQTAIGPVILVSGVGLLLLTMTNRLGRVIDRVRLLGRELKGATREAEEPLLAQLQILSARAALIRQAIALTAFSVLFAAILVIVLFVTALFRLEDAWLIGVLFIGCMMSLIGAMIAFICDLKQSLVAMRLELDADLKGFQQRQEAFSRASVVVPCGPKPNQPRLAFQDDNSVPASEPRGKTIRSSYVW